MNYNPIEADDCPGFGFAEIGEEYDCYVLDCDSAEFQFEYHGANIYSGIVFIIIGGLLLLSTCYVCAYRMFIKTLDECRTCYKHGIPV